MKEEPLTKRRFEETLIAPKTFVEEIVLPHRSVPVLKGVLARH